MIIRKEQMMVFQKQAEKNFEDQVIFYLTEKFPVNCKLLSNEELRAVVQFGRDQAKTYECFGDQSIVMYIHLMFMLGSYFDCDPLLPWAGEILNKTEEYEVERMDSLWQKAHEYVFSINGKDNEYLLDALSRIREYRVQVFPNKIESTNEKSIDHLLKSFFPEKFEVFIGSRIQSLIQAGRDKAEKYGITTLLEANMLTVFMFILGSEFDNDLIFPWAGRILHDDSIKEQNKKIALLYEEAIKFLNNFLPAEVR